jgi:hypothetical protein
MRDSMKLRGRIIYPVSDKRLNTSHKEESGEQLQHPRRCVETSTIHSPSQHHLHTNLLHQNQPTILVPRVPMHRYLSLIHLTLHRAAEPSQILIPHQHDLVPCLARRRDHGGDYAAEETHFGVGGDEGFDECAVAYMIEGVT